jgi:DUF1680 family protein
VHLEDDFWEPRRRLNRSVTLPAQYRLLESTGRLDNFRRAAGRPELPFRGFFFNDSDVYKWLEGVCWALSDGGDANLAELVDQVIDLVAAAQEPDGYLDTYFTYQRAGERWGNLRDMHELYCAGHLISAAVAHHRATGAERLLEIARRLADHIVKEFAGDRQPGVPGHPEIEMALAELYRETGEREYLTQAQRFLDRRGLGQIGSRDYHLDHIPLRQMERLVGHAVRALYLCAGAADLAAETGEAELVIALERLWKRTTARQMYVTGGLGARTSGEAFGEDYELPNRQAYAETCAAIASILWNARMLQFQGEARYADLLELALYNAALAGISLDGLSYFYTNPLADLAGDHRRQPWFDCACCPTNIVRLLAVLPGYFYSLSQAPTGVWIHLYAQGRADFILPDGRPFGVKQQTRYPWDGEIGIEIQAQGELALFLRIPEWAGALDPAALQINGIDAGIMLEPGTYACLQRAWRPGDLVRLSLPMPARRVRSHPHLFETAGRVSLARGPLVYCLEGTDQPDIDLRDVVLPAGATITAEVRPDLPGGMTTLRFDGLVRSPGPAWENRLYRPDSGERLGTHFSTHFKSFTAIPYYAWANRSPGPMQVWLRE